MGLPERISELALLYGSIAKFADTVGVARNTVYGWTKSTGNPKASDLALLTSKTSVDLNWLLTGEGNKPIAPNVNEKVDSDTLGSIERSIVFVLKEIEAQKGMLLSTGTTPELIASHVLEVYKQTKR